VKRLLQRILIGEESPRRWSERRYRARLKRTNAIQLATSGGPVFLLLTESELRVLTGRDNILFIIRMRSPVRLTSEPVIPLGLRALLVVVTALLAVPVLLLGFRRLILEWELDGIHMIAEFRGGHGLARLYRDVRERFPFVLAESRDLG